MLDRRLTIGLPGEAGIGAADIGEQPGAGGIGCRRRVGHVELER
jgi:hypothetical protein